MGGIVGVDFAAALRCGHGKPIRQCAKCSREGEEYERDSAIIEAAEGLPPAEWARRARLFAREALRIRRVHGRGSKEHRKAREAVRQCLDLARILGEIAIKRGLRDAPRPSLLVQGATDPATGEIVEHGPAAVGPRRAATDRRTLEDMAADHEDSARRLREARGANHPDTLRHEKAAKRLRRAARKVKR